MAKSKGFKFGDHPIGLAGRTAKAMTRKRGKGGPGGSDKPKNYWSTWNGVKEVKTQLPRKMVRGWK